MRLLELRHEDLRVRLEVLIESRSAAFGSPNYEEVRFGSQAVTPCFAMERSSFSLGVIFLL
jgi:hypothetical protein